MRGAHGLRPVGAMQNGVWRINQVGVAMRGLLGLIGLLLVLLIVGLNVKHALSDRVVQGPVPTAASQAEPARQPLDAYAQELNKAMAAAAARQASASE